MSDSLTEKEAIDNYRRNKQKSIWQAIVPEVHFEASEYYPTIDNGDIFRYFVARSQKEGAEVKNCYLCKYHAHNTSLYHDPTGRKPVFCKHLRRAFGSNDAIECKFFRIGLDHVDSYFRRVKVGKKFIDKD